MNKKIRKIEDEKKVIEKKRKLEFIFHEKGIDSKENSYDSLDELYEKYEKTWYNKACKIKRNIS